MSQNYYYILVCQELYGNYENKKSAERDLAEILKEDDNINIRIIKGVELKFELPKTATIID